jgi:hypothetical protein
MIENPCLIICAIRRFLTVIITQLSMMRLSVSQMHYSITPVLQYPGHLLLALPVNFDFIGEAGFSILEGSCVA